MSLLVIATPSRIALRHAFSSLSAVRWKNFSSTPNESSYEDEVRTKILEASLPFVVEKGWSKSALAAGANSIGYPGIVHGLFNRAGGDLVHYFQKRSNIALVDILKELSEKGPEKPLLKPEEFIEIAVRRRLEMIVPYLSRWPQAIAIMALPPNVAEALASLLTCADDICYYAGDRSVNFNWYTRRLGVAGVYKATEIYLIQDTSAEHQATWDFLKKRLNECVHIDEILTNSNVGGPEMKDKVTSAFITARNMLGLNWTR